MSTPINTGYIVNAPAPIDSRMRVNTYADLASLAIVYIGLLTYVIDEDAEYRYYSSGWVKWTTDTSGIGVWGSITGTLADQTDLNAALELKFDKIGGTITGEVTVEARTFGHNFILKGSEVSSESLLLPDAPYDNNIWGRQNGNWAVINQDPGGSFSQKEIVTIENPSDYSNTTISNGLGQIPDMWHVYVECKITHQEDGRTYNTGARIGMVSQHNAENDDIRGIQVLANDTSYNVIISNCKIFGSNTSSANRGTVLDWTYWRLKIIGLT